MNGEGSSEVFEIKKANIRHHNVEAELFERLHPEGSNLYERSHVLKSINFVSRNSGAKMLCVDVGCGTGFVASFELPLYKTVIATDISRRMVETVKMRLGHFDSLNLIVCDAENLPLRSEIANFVSISSVLHHLPKPLDSLTEISRILKQGGFLYVTREPNHQRFRRFFDSFDKFFVRRIVAITQRLLVSKPSTRELDVRSEDLEYHKVDVHYPTGFHVEWLASFLNSKSFKVLSAYSYHWIFSDSSFGLFQKLLAKSNFIVEKIPVFRTLGRYVSLTARKL